MDDAPKTLSSESLSNKDPGEEELNLTPEGSVHSRDNNGTGVPDEIGKGASSDLPTTPVVAEQEVEGHNVTRESDLTVPDLENSSSVVPDSSTLISADIEQEDVKMGGNISALVEADASDNDDEKSDVVDEKKEEESPAATGLEDGFFDDHADWAERLVDDDDFDSGTPEDSRARSEWLAQKRESNEENEYLDHIMAMVGHEEVKNHFLAVKARVEVAKRWNEDMKQINIDLFLQGNNGTGEFFHFCWIPTWSLTLMNRQKENCPTLRLISLLHWRCSS